MQAIPGVKFDRSTGYWTVVGGCAAVSSLPAVTFTIGGASLDLQPQQWTRPVCLSSLTQAPASLDMLSAAPPSQLTAGACMASSSCNSLHQVRAATRAGASAVWVLNGLPLGRPCGPTP